MHTIFDNCVERRNDNNKAEKNPAIPSTEPQNLSTLNAAPSSLPWHLDTQGWRSHIIDAGGETVGWKPSRIADAEYITLACNSFPELVEALRQARTHIAYLSGDAEYDVATERVKAVIEKALANTHTKS